MIYFTDQEIDQWIMEDVPYVDLTTSFLRLENKPAKIQIATKESTVVCCTEEVMKIFNKLGIHTTLFTPSGEHLEKDVKFMEGEGLSGTLFAVSRTVENLLRYSSGIATRTRLLVERAREANNQVILVTSRKTIPNTRKIAIKAVKAGGAAIHRFGLSESILIYKDHYRMLGGLEHLNTRISERKDQSGGKPVAVVVDDIQEAFIMARAGVDTLQLNYAAPADAKKLKKELGRISPSTRLAVAGNITLKNVKEYAASGADILISSWPYFGETPEMSLQILPIYNY
jgi:molybdenum transport protein